MSIAPADRTFFGPTASWLVDAAIGGAGALIILLSGRAIHRRLQPAEIDSIVPSA